MASARLDDCGSGFPSGFLRAKVSPVHNPVRKSGVALPSDETDDAGGQQQAAESAKHPADDFAQQTARRRRDLVRTELHRAALCLRGLEASLWCDTQAAERLIDGHMVPIEFGQVLNKRKVSGFVRCWAGETGGAGWEADLWRRLWMAYCCCCPTSWWLPSASSACGTRWASAPRVERSASVSRVFCAARAWCLRHGHGDGSASGRW